MQNFVPTSPRRLVHNGAPLSLLIGMALLQQSPAHAQAIAKPNIIVFYADDQGFADLSAQGAHDDVRTPNIDALAAGGVRALNGYSTAPQCVPSRAGLLSGRTQNRFGVEDNGTGGEILATQTSFPKRLQSAGYVTAMFGKWHMGDQKKVVNYGFTHQFPYGFEGDFPANIDSNGNDRPLGTYTTNAYHIDACSQAAAALIRRYRDKPFLLYIAYRAPHTPLDPPQKYIDRFSGPMPERRRRALAMISAVDDGVGLITKTLHDMGLTEKTLIFYTADNGAPLKITKQDSPISMAHDDAGWDGSLNDPLNGEKGTLIEGGMHEPFVVAWKGVIPPGRTYSQPISTLDIGATAVAVSGATASPDSLDGVNLIPYLTGKNASAPHEFLAWRWDGQAGIRMGDWKFLTGGGREYLYHLGIDLEEKFNLLAQYPQIAARLKTKLTAWAQELVPPGIPPTISKQANEYFDYYLEQTAPAVKVIPAACQGHSYTLPNGKKVSGPGIYLDTVSSGATKTVNAYILPEGCGGGVATQGRLAPSDFEVKVEPGIGALEVHTPYPARIEIFDAQGALRYQGTMQGNVLRIDVQGWSPAVYLVRASYRTKVRIGK